MEDRVPTRTEALLFWSKASVLRLNRGLLNLRDKQIRHKQVDVDGYPFLVAESQSALFHDENGERQLQLGKVQNIRCALQRLNGVVIPAGQIFSFWKQIGRATKQRGYVEGRELRQGCLIPSVGGGLCQLSNALYQAALISKCEITERHEHSQVVPGSDAEKGLDATVAWNYVDLRFRPKQNFRIQAELSRDKLIVQFHSDHPMLAYQNSGTITSEHRSRIQTESHSCHSCGIESCFRHKATPNSLHPAGNRTAFVLDENWPEYKKFVADQLRESDVIATPIDGNRWRLKRYSWQTGKSAVYSAPWSFLSRTIESHRLGAYGARRLQAQLKASKALSDSFARQIPADVTHVRVSQSLLPFLWSNFFLGGRTFDVFMTRLPLRLLHARLDSALEQHPERSTLGEFRAPEWIVEAEWQALQSARRIISPHSEIVSLFPETAQYLDWVRPSIQRICRGSHVVFPGPTAARKGAYELRTVAEEMNFPVMCLGSELEGEDFWSGIKTEASASDWLTRASVVVQPALVEDSPRKLIAALAAGIPVIATPACGLPQQSGLTLVPYGDVSTLKHAIAESLNIRSETPPARL